MILKVCEKTGAEEMALSALATLAVGMSQLEIGELGVASFGKEMKLLHPFNHPFTSESGTNLVRNFLPSMRNERAQLYGSKVLVGHWKIMVVTTRVCSSYS